MAGELSILVAFGGGLFSFLSPCVLPLFPSYLSFITGMSLDQLQSASAGDARGRRWILAHSLAFVLGFSMVFVGMGASFSALGQLLFDYRDRIRLVGGAAHHRLRALRRRPAARSASSGATSRSSSAPSRPGSSGHGWSA